MITKEFLEKHFKHHDKLVIYQGDIPLTITKAWHLHFSGGHHDFDIYDCADLADLCRKRHLALKPYNSEADRSDGYEADDHSSIIPL